MIEKKIHYCWFGGKPLSELTKKCIESWKKYCPDYEIIEWNENNFDIHCCKYVEEAYNEKKWAFVSDYCRFWILYNCGGIYLDTDVELIKPLDNLPDNFVGFENKSACNSGLIRGALPKDKVCELMLESYANDVFLLADGSLNLKTVCERETSILCEYGLLLNGERQTVLNTEIFPVDYFCPIDTLTRKCEITKNTYSIHHYSGSWLSGWQKFKQKVRAIVGNKFYLKLAETKKKIKKK